MLVTPAQHIHYVYVHLAVKAEHHAVGRPLVVTSTVVVMYVDQHVTQTLLFAVSKVQHIKAGADLTHGTMCHKVHTLAAACDQLEHIAANTGWVATQLAEIFGQVVVVELLLATADVAGVVGVPAV